MSEIEALNRPHYKRFKVQGEDRFLAAVHKNAEYKSVGGLVIPNTEVTQDIETTGVVLAISPKFDHEKYPDVVVGANIRVVLNTWATFTCHGDKLAFGSAEYVIAAYDYD